VQASKVPMIERLVARLKSPLVLNGYALVFSSGATSALGVIYWILAARLYPEATVGLNSAALAAMFFLANLSQLNLVHALNRFVPAAGRSTAKLVATAYLVSAALALLTSGVFLIGIDRWAPSLRALRADPASAAWFMFATASWCIFTIQDGVLAGLRQAKWVPLSTTSYALIKLAVIALAATLLPRGGIFFSWTAPVLLLVLPVSALIFLRLVPQHVAAAGAGDDTFKGRSVVRFVAGDYLASLVWMATVNLLPVLIVERAGASAGAYFYLAWTIAYTLYFVSVNMCMSLVTEGARDEARLNLYSLETLKQTLRLVVPIVAVIVVGAPHVLRLYGSAYAAEGATLLRLLCLSAIPYAFVAVRISMARVQRKILTIFCVYGALCVLALGLTHVLLDRYGVVGVGWAWLVAQTLMMGVLLLSDLRKAWWPLWQRP
jgi:O-antigen/teichoic acid export membrane protein